MEAYLKARAKINISLDITGKRDDGYHDMKMIMQTLELYDSIYIKKIESRKIKLAVSHPWLPTDEKNLAYKAADILRSRYSIEDGIFINIRKSIPISAGLAGGSADCAAALVGIRNLFSLPVSNAELMSIGAELGADVPFCIFRGTALAEGIGEKLTRLHPHPRAYVLLVKPPVSISTASVFKQFDNKTTVLKRPDTDSIIRSIDNSDLKGIAGGFCNVLESVTVRMAPIIGDIKQLLMSKGALGALMSGSGPTVFAYFKERQQARQASEAVRAEFPSIKDVFLTRIYNV